MKKQLSFLMLMLGLAPFFTVHSFSQAPCFSGSFHQNRQLSVIQGNALPVVFGMSSEDDMQFSYYIYPQRPEWQWSGTMPIPDGPLCSPSSVGFSVMYSCFSAGSIVTSANDILSVCVNMEHSYYSDIKIEISCSKNNGQRQMAILKYHNGIQGSIYMGNANDNDSSVGCNEGVPGTGWSYCWTENSDYAQINSSSFGSNNTISNNIIDSSNRAEHTNYYTPFESFNNLIGCVLNGEWTLRITDVRGGDNGFLFNWDIQFSEELMPPTPPDTAIFDSIRIMHYSIDTTFQGNVVTLTPQNIGNQTYFAIAYTDDGCAYHTQIAVEVLEDTENAIPNLQPQSANWNVTLYPNPAQDNTTLILDKSIDDVNVSIFNMLGQLMYQSSITAETTTLPTAQYPFGVYMVKISDKNGTTKTVKLLKQ